MQISFRSRRLLALAILFVLVSLLCTPFRNSFRGEMGTVMQIIPEVHAAESCEQPVRRFLGGPGRRPGRTPIYVSIRQQLRTDEGVYVFASSDETVMEVTKSFVPLKVTLENHSTYEIGNAIFSSGFSGPEGAPVVDSIQGATYDKSRKMFLVPSVPAGGTTEVTFILEFPQEVGMGLYQYKVTLTEFSVLDTQDLFPARTPENAVNRSRSNVEQVGIGGTDVVCFSGLTTTLLPRRTVEAVIAGEGKEEKRREDEENNEEVIKKIGLPAPMPSVFVRKSVSTTEAQPGMTVRYTITVINNGKITLEELVVDDRFQSDKITVEDAGGGDMVQSGIQWFIEKLAPGDRWFTAYTVRVNDTVAVGEVIPSTVRVIAEELIGTPTTPRSDSVQMTVIYELPRTGSLLSAVALLEWGMALLVAGVIIICGTLCFAKRYMS